MSIVNMYRPGNSPHMFTKRQLRCAGWTDSQIEMFCTEVPVDVPSTPKVSESSRSKACDEMFGVLLKMPDAIRHNRSDICEALYDAGYRKPRGHQQDPADIDFGLKPGEHVHHPRTLEFRPIRTPEQIAAEERRKAGLDIALICTGHSDRSKDNWATLGEIIYDAGYRKQVQP